MPLRSKFPECQANTLAENNDRNNRNKSFLFMDNSSAWRFPDFCVLIGLKWSAWESYLCSSHCMRLWHAHQYRTSNAEAHANMNIMPHGVLPHITPHLGLFISKGASIVALFLILIRNCQISCNQESSADKRSHIFIFVTPSHSIPQAGFGVSESTLQI